jgi:Asp-tRNA(Asn)/Glu-tRNA(Gln) amidotransferase A subunit family amidase
MKMRGTYLRLVSRLLVLLVGPAADVVVSAESSIGCPIGLQVVAPKYEDERLMAALKIIDRVLAKT